MDLLTSKYKRAEMHWQHGLEDLDVFLWGDKVRGHHMPGFVWTKDEHYKLGEESPRKRFPDKDYLRTVSELYTQEQMLIVYKSRQMMVTWFMCAAFVWRGLHPGNNLLHLCKSEDGSIKNLKRMRFIWDNLPEFFVPKIEPAHETPRMTQMTIHHPEAKSIIHGANQNSDYARQETVSEAWVDEADFCTNVDEMMSGLMPTVQGGGRFVATTTPNGLTYFLTRALDGKRLNVKDIDQYFSRNT